MDIIYASIETAFHTYFLDDKTATLLRKYGKGQQKLPLHEKDFVDLFTE